MFLVDTQGFKERRHHASHEQKDALHGWNFRVEGVRPQEIRLEGLCELC